MMKANVRRNTAVRQSHIRFVLSRTMEANDQILTVSSVANNEINSFKDLTFITGSGLAPAQSCSLRLYVMDTVRIAYADQSRP